MTAWTSKFEELNIVMFFAGFGTICRIKKRENHPWRSVTFSKVAGFYLACNFYQK